MDESFDLSLTRSIANESLADLLGNIAETSIDSVMETGALRDIPIIGMFFGIMKAGRDIGAAIYVRKIAIFLKHLSTISYEKRQEFIGTLGNEKEKHEFGQSVLLLLERADDMKKPLLIAKIMKAYILGKIAENKAMRLCAIVNRCYIQDLELLRNFVDGPQGESIEIAESLMSVGLLSNGGLNRGVKENSLGKKVGFLNSSEVVYILNEYGKLLKEFALEN